MTFIELESKAFSLIRKNWKFLAISGIFDMLFFVIYGFFHSFLFLRIDEITSLLMQAISSTQSLGSYLLLIALHFAVFVIFFYLLYSFFQGMSWKHAHKICGSDMDIKYFFKVNLKWLAIMFFVMLLQYIRRLVSLINNSSTMWGDIVFYMAFFFTAYLALTSYASKESSMKNSLKKAWTYNNFRALLTAALIFFALNFLLQATSKIILVNLLIGLLLFIPYLTFTRVSFILATKKRRIKHDK